MVVDGGLVDVDDSVLIVIDVQERFLDKLPAEEAASIRERIGWLVRVAGHLDVPAVVTAEDVAALGAPIPEVSDALGDGTPIHDKLVFGLAADPAILAAVRGTGRRTAILVGLETDVCVAQSAVGLLDAGFRVIAVRDAMGSPGHADGLARLQGAGVLILSVRGLYYEWVRTVKRAAAVRGAVPAPPNGLRL